ncbi:MAG: multidrug ABC transporter permease [Aerococcus suis]|nr:multidrug ABC transporter permease [Aerococcus suis]
MLRFIRLILFHLKVYINNQYFLWLPIISTATIFVVQYLTAYAYNQLNDHTLWIRSAIFGLWTSATTSTGAISFQKHQGTLPYLINTGINELISLTALILPAYLFGLIAFPLSYILAIIFQVNVLPITLEFILMIFMLWLSVAIMDMLIAAFFVLTPNAIVYEELIHIPILLCSGLLGSSGFFKSLTLYTQWVIPLVYPIQKMIGEEPFIYSIWSYLFSSLTWIILAISLGRTLLLWAKRDGQRRIV